MHKNTKLTPVRRKEIYELWCKGTTVSALAEIFRVTRRVVYLIIARARLGDFSVHRTQIPF